MYRQELKEVETHCAICTKNSQYRSISKRCDEAVLQFGMLV